MPHRQISRLKTNLKNIAILLNCLIPVCMIHVKIIPVYQIHVEIQKLKIKPPIWSEGLDAH